MSKSKKKPEVSTQPQPKPSLPAKKMTNQEVRELVKTSRNLKADPENVLRDLGKVMVKIEGMSDEELKQVDADKNVSETWGLALSLYNLDNHVLLVQATGDDYRSFAIEFTNQLCKEYDCQTPSEKSMAQLVANAYVRVLEYTRHLRRSTNIEYLSKEKNGYYSMLGRELDRANRHYITALTTLKQMKSPQMAVTVKTETAYIAQNQQVNNNPERQQGEIIDG